MPKIARELSDVAVRRLKHGFIKGATTRQKKEIGEPCTAYHAVGGVAGLLLQCRPPVSETSVGARSWILRTTVGNRRRDYGLGGYPDVPLAVARQKARELKEKISQGIDPLAEKRAAKSALIAGQVMGVTFKQVAAEFVKKKAREFKTAKQVQKLENMLEIYAFPFIGNLLVGEITRAHIVAMLKPTWETKTETASRTRLYVERILDRATVEGLRSGANPAAWKGNLDVTFPPAHKVAKVQNYAALPVQEMPEFWKKLSEHRGIGAAALRFLILTAARSGEARGAVWSEIDLQNKIWTVPENRMKAGKPHRVPLSSHAVALLQELPRDESGYLFANTRGAAISDVLISKTPKAVGFNVTAHGFRSTFKNWCIECGDVADEISELALAHVNNDKTRAAYARTDAFEIRRDLMRRWAEFVTGATT
jgi:integrase